MVETPSEYSRRDPRISQHLGPPSSVAIYYDEIGIHALPRLEPALQRKGVPEEGNRIQRYYERLDEVALERHQLGDRVAHERRLLLGQQELVHHRTQFGQAPVWHEPGHALCGQSLRTQLVQVQQVQQPLVSVGAQ